MMSSILPLPFLPTRPIQEKSEPRKDSGNSWTAMKILVPLASPEIEHSRELVSGWLLKEQRVYTGSQMDVGLNLSFTNY